MNGSAHIGMLAILAVLLSSSGCQGRDSAETKPPPSPPEKSDNDVEPPGRQGGEAQ